MFRQESIQAVFIVQTYDQPRRDELLFSIDTACGSSNMFACRTNQGRTSQFRTSQCRTNSCALSSPWNGSGPSRKDSIILRVWRSMPMGHFGRAANWDRFTASDRRDAYGRLAALGASAWV